MMRGDDAIGSVPAHRGVDEVSVHLVDEQVALRFLEFVEDYDALLRRSVVLQEVEKPLEQIRVVLPQTVPGRGMGIGLDDAGERATVQLRADLEDGGDVVELRHPQGLQHSGVRARPVIESSASQRGDFHRIHFYVQHPVTEHLLLQQNLSLELSAPIAVAPAEATDLGLVQLGDNLTHGPVLNCNSGQHLVGRCAVVMTRARSLKFY